MDFTISNEQKLQTARSILGVLEINFYSQLLSLGFDPENFNIDSLESSDVPEMQFSIDAVKKSYNSILNTKKIIDELS